MVCPYCRKQIPTDAKVCPNCKAEVPKAEVPKKETPKKTVKEKKSNG